MSKLRKQRAGGRSTSTKTKSLIPFMGGKYKLASKIVPIITYAKDAFDLTAYREWCGGGGRILLNLLPDLFEERWYNDLDLGLAQLMAIVGDSDGVNLLKEILWEAGVGQDVFLSAKQSRENNENALMGAASTYIATTQSYAAGMTSYSNVLENYEHGENYYNRMETLESYQAILDGVKVTAGNCFELLEECQHDEFALLYLDPPYYPSSMKTQNHYGERSWDIFEHQILVVKLLETEMKAVLSGYDTDCYQPLVDAGWTKIHLGEVAVSSSGAARVKAHEYVWINFDIPDELLDKVSEPE